MPRLPIEVLLDMVENLWSEKDVLGVMCMSWTCWRLRTRVIALANAYVKRRYRRKRHGGISPIHFIVVNSTGTCELCNGTMSNTRRGIVCQKCGAKLSEVPQTILRPYQKPFKLDADCWQHQRKWTHRVSDHVFAIPDTTMALLTVQTLRRLELLHRQLDIWLRGNAEHSGQKYQVLLVNPRGVEPFFKWWGTTDAFTQGAQIFRIKRQEYLEAWASNPGHVTLPTAPIPVRAD